MYDAEKDRPRLQIDFAVTARREIKTDMHAGKES
jgi:hypothetical protein